MKIFIVQGVVIGLIGTLLGSVGGIVLALNLDVVVPFIERLVGVQFLAKDVYYISELPSDLHWSDVWTISVVSFVLTILATLYPSWRASRTQPAEALRYE
jgi:lipoprotein-releasing system permease protein